MTKYRVIEKGFYQGHIYSPNGKRPFVFTDKPLKPVPSWLKVVKAETAAEKKNRLKKEKENADTAKKTAENNQKEIDNMSFMGEGESNSSVETL